MICQKCDVNNKVYLPISFTVLLELFFDKKEISKYQTIEDFYLNENADYLAKSIIKCALEDPQLYNKIQTANEEINKSKETCDVCGNDICLNLYAYESNYLYKKLALLLDEYEYTFIHEKTRIDKSKLVSLIENVYFNHSYILKQVLTKFDINEVQRLEQVNKVIKFFECDERGGDNYLPFITYLTGLISGTFLPNILYDISKYGLSKIVRVIRFPYLANHTSKTVINKIESETENNLEMINDSILKGLTKKQRKKVLNKIIQYQLKNQNQLIEKKIN